MDPTLVILLELFTEEIPSTGKVETNATSRPNNACAYTCADVCIALRTDINSHVYRLIQSLA